MGWVLFLTSFLLALGHAVGFDLHGVVPQEYADKEQIKDFAISKLTSSKTRIPYEYYSLPFCRPPDMVSSANDPGDVSPADRTFDSGYQLTMREDSQCKILCRIPALTEADSKQFSARIQEDYRVNMSLDNLPVATVRWRAVGDAVVKDYVPGYPVGFTLRSEDNRELAKAYIHNHLRFNVLYHLDHATQLRRIVGCEVEPFSVKHRYEGEWPKDPQQSPTFTTCNPERVVYHDAEPQLVQAGEEVVFTYDTMFTRSDIEWASQWDAYMRGHEGTKAWLPAINCVATGVLLVGMVAAVIVSLAMG